MRTAHVQRLVALGDFAPDRSIERAGQLDRE